MLSMGEGNVPKSTALQQVEQQWLTRGWYSLTHILVVKAGNVGMCQLVEEGAEKIVFRVSRGDGECRKRNWKMSSVYRAVGSLYGLGGRWVDG